MKKSFVDVSKLLEEPGGEIAYVGDVSLDAAALGREDVEFPGPFTVKLKLSNVSGRIRIAGSAGGDIVLRCGRCLDKTRRRVEAPIEEMAAGAVEGAEEVFPVESGRIDLAPIVFQNIALEIPFKPLCRPDCAGLCRTCGKNLNVEPHEHENQEIDERLAPLKKYFKKQ